MRIFNLMIFIFCACLTLVGYALADEFTFDQEKVFEAGKEVATLKLSNVSGEVIVESHLQDNIIIHAVKVIKAKNQQEAKQKADQIQISIVKEGSVITVDTRFPKFNSGNFWGNIFGNESGNSGWVNYHILVPAKTRIDIHTASADVSVRDIEEKVNVGVASGDVALENITGEASVVSASGDIDLYNTQGKVNLTGASSDIKIRRAKGDIQIVTASGDVSGEKIEGKLSVSLASGDLELSEVNGDIEAHNASGELNIKQNQGGLDLSTSSGNINAKTIITQGRDYSLQSASGDVQLYIPLQSSADFKLETASGNIKCKAPVELHTATSKKIEGRINAGGAQIKIQTTSGDIFLIGE